MRVRAPWLLKKEIDKANSSLHLKEKNMNTKQKDQEYVAATYARFPVEIVRGKGALWYDENGKEYVDMGSGIAVNALGASDDGWVKAVTEQLARIQHVSNLYYSEPQARLAEMLCTRTGMKRVFFGNSGAEANECAIKVARKYASEKHGADTYRIITLKNSFHGRTLTTLAATGQDVFHQDFLPLTDGFLYAEANNIASLRALVEENKVAAIMVEIVQGEGGVLPLDRAFCEEIEKIRAEKDILFIVDEVQTGNGRTGALYAYMNYGLSPDVVTTAKGLGGGLPIGACLLGERVKDVLGVSSHGSTFGGNPIAAAGACHVIERLDESLLSSVREKSDRLVSALSEMEGVKSVSGMGLMLGVETEKPVGEVLDACFAGGVIALKAKNKLRLLPPLNITDKELDRAIEAIRVAVKP